MRQTFRWIMAAVFLALLGLAVAGLLLTNAGKGPPSLGASGTEGRPAGAKGPVDESPLITARDLAGLATTPEEQALSQEALRLADHEVDLAFGQALRNAAAAPPSASPAALRLEQRVKEAQAQVDADRKAAAQLSAKVARAGAVPPEEMLQQLQLAKAELALDQDELQDLRNALLNFGGSEEAQLQALLTEHEKSESHRLTQGGAEAETAGPETGATGGAAGAQTSKATTAAGSGRSFLARMAAWTRLRGDANTIEKARAAALADEAGFGRERDGLEAKLQAERSQPPAGARSRSASVASELSSLRQLDAEHQNLASWEDRTAVETALARVYGQWLVLVNGQRERALHQAIGSAFWILLVLFLAVVADLLISRLFSRFSFDRKRLHTIRSVLRFAMRAVAAVLILVVILGPPRQLGTMVGLVGAGLAVALKDFIVAFLGWFRLIGPNGMRPGDWVEINGTQQINGVQGKVLEVGLLFTVLLETGNWTDAGHPTGRRVAFINSFAIEGYYFNFTTAGQWLWDEIRFGLPTAVDAHPVLEALQKAAESETAGHAVQAEREWTLAMAGWGLGPFSAKPVITVRPTESGWDVVIRYLAKADEREELRQRLSHTVFETLRNLTRSAGRLEGAATRAEPA